MTARGNLLTNTASLFTGAMSAKIFSLISVLMLSRYLGVEDFGRYSLVFTFWALLNTLVDLGAGALLGREIAHNPAEARRPVEAAIYLRQLGSLLLLPIAFFLSPMIGLSTDLTLLTFVGIILGAEAFFDAYFSAVMRLDLSAKSRFWAGLVNVSLLAAAVVFHLPLFWIVLISLLNPLVKLWIDWGLLPQDKKPGLYLRLPQGAPMLAMFKDSWPLWLMGIQYIILARVDTLMLGALSPTGEHDLGIYSAAYRFSEILALLINSIGPSLLPILVQAMKNPARMQFITSTGIRVVVGGVMVISLLIFWYAPLIVELCYGPAYQDATLCMRILVWSQALVAVNTLCYQVLMVYNVQGRWSVLSASIGVTILNIALNAWLIPHYQAVGSSIATVITEIVALITMLYFVRRHTPNRLTGDILRLELFCIPACLLPALLGWGWGFLSALVYLPLLFWTKTLTVPMIRKLAHQNLHESD